MCVNVVHFHGNTKWTTCGGEIKTRYNDVVMSIDSV